MTDMRALPAPNTDRWAWQLRASCRGVDSGYFFPPDNERGAARTARTSRAKSICRRCPVLAECRRHALTLAEPHGVWGGLTEHERDELLRLSGRGLLSG